MSALGTKLRRDLVRMRGQAVTIALVVACGVAAYVSLFSAYRSLEVARDRFYETQRFGDAFATCKRAPDSVRADLEAIEGVTMVETHEAETVLLPMPELDEPGIGRIITLESGKEPSLDAPLLRSGRFPEPGREDEVVLLESFASAHALVPGSVIPAVLNGVRRELRVVGTALSPEYVFAVGGGSFLEDPERFSVLWMDRDAVAPAFQMDGAFNEVAVRLTPTANVASVLSELDRVLAPHGGWGAVARERQVSNYMLTTELSQLSNMATSIPTIFLLVAAFLLNVVLSRTVQLQRGQIATLKAVGYTDLTIGLYYLRLVALISIVGAAFGVGVGAWLGHGMLDLYRPYFRFPDLTFRLDPSLVATAILLSLGAATMGALATVRSIARLAPAEAMRPETPAGYHASWLERLGIGRLFTTSGHMVLRELLRRPWRTTLSVLGIAMALAILVAGRASGDSVDAFMNVEFELARRDDLTVQLLEPKPESVVRTFEQLEGVRTVEPQRTVAIRLHAGHVFRDVALMGHPRDSDLRRVVVWPPRVVPMPEDGVLLTDALAKNLGLAVGDDVEIELLEGDRRSRKVRVAGTVHEILGLQAHMDLTALQALLGEEGAVTELSLTVDPEGTADVERQLLEIPAVSGFARRQTFVDRLETQTTQKMTATTIILTLFASIISIGVIYNQARIALSMRARDLASLRILGFTRAEISRVLLGELATYVLLAIAPGLWLGAKIFELIMGTVQDMYRFPVIVSAETNFFAAMVTIAAAVASALVVRRQLDRLDLVGVLKTRE